MFNQFFYLYLDLKRWKISTFKDFFYLCFEPAIWVTILYRFARFLFLCNIPIIKILFRLISFLTYKFMELFLGAAINPCTEIGPGLYIGHTGGIRIAPEVIIGKNLSIGPFVFIARKGLGIQGAPTIGDNVFIGVGAKILGPIIIGNNVHIGANAVVVKAIPDNCTAVGVPATIKARN